MRSPRDLDTQECPTRVPYDSGGVLELGVVAPPVRRGASSMRMRRWSAGRAAARTLRTRARRLASGRFQTIGSRPASWGMHGFSANSADTAPKKVLLSNEPSAQPDHCSAGAGSTAQSKQRAGSGPSQSGALRVHSAKRASTDARVDYNVTEALDYARNTGRPKTHFE